MTDFGESALVSLVIISALQVFASLFLYKWHAEIALKSAQASQYFQFFLIVFAFATQVHAYVVTDLSVFNVAMNTHRDACLLYKITGVWGNHEGSMLLWLLVLVFYGAAVAALSSCAPSLKIKVLSIQSMLTCLFSLFVFYTSNPFLETSVPFLAGRDLNPILQDPALAFHPPTLYLGFAGFSIVLSFALASLLEKSPNVRWVEWVRPWALAAWSFLTLGITMGSWWAYYELGWGGWWFWDPVENTSLMPWLAGTALIHVFAVVQKRRQLLRWSYFLSILCFLFSLLGTFLVRSGALSSVHAFSSAPERGIVLFAIFAGVSFLSLAIFLVRFKKFALNRDPIPLSSRTGAILFNNHFLLTLAFTVFLGTSYPLLIEAVTGETITVGTPYFAATFVPLSLPLLGLMGVSVWMKRGEKTRQKTSPFLHLWFPFVLTLWVVLGLLLLEFQHWRAILMAGASVWVLSSTLSAAIQKRRQNSWPMILGHGGLAIAVLGMAIDTLGMKENLVALKKGESIEFQGYAIKLQSIQRLKFPTYEAERATIYLKKGKREYTLFPEKRFYPHHQTLTTETALHHFWFSNLYFALGSFLPGERWTLRIYYHPLVELIWLGGLLLAAAGFLSIISQVFQRMRRGGFRKRTCQMMMMSLASLFLQGVYPVAEAGEIEGGERLVNSAVEQRARVLFTEIRCPVCAGQSIEDSNAPLARELRRSIRKALMEGQTDVQIRQHLVSLYGENVLFRPLLDSKNLALWVLPFLVALGGAGFMIWHGRKDIQ